MYLNLIVDYFRCIFGFKYKCEKNSWNFNNVVIEFIVLFENVFLKLMLGENVFE